MHKFRVGQRARIIRKDAGVNASGKPFCGMTGVITKVDGVNILLRPLYYKHKMHFIDNGGELEPIRTNVIGDEWVI